MTKRLKGTRIATTLPIPGGGSGPPIPGTYPAWRTGKSVGTIYTLGGSVNMSGLPYNNYAVGGNYMVDPWLGWALDEGGSRIFLVNAGGHDQSPPHDAGNPIVKLDLKLDGPQWRYIDVGTTNAAAVTQSKYYLDGRPASRHTYFSPKYIAPNQMADGKERVATFAAYAGFATGQVGVQWSQGPDVQSFVIDVGYWTAHTANGDGSIHGWEYPDLIPPVPNWAGPGTTITEMMPCQAQDPATGDVYTVGRDAANYGWCEARKWTAATNTWSPVLRTTANGDPVRGGASPTLYDRIRKQIVTLWDQDGARRIIRMSTIPPYTCSTTDVVNYPSIGGACIYDGFVHDLDNDRYLIVHPDGGDNGVGGIYSMNVTTAAMTRLSDTLPMRANICTRLQYIPNMHCVMWLGRYGNAIEFMPTA